MPTSRRHFIGATRSARRTRVRAAGRAAPERFAQRPPPRRADRQRNSRQWRRRAVHRGGRGDGRGRGRLRRPAHARQGAWGNQIFTTRDYREVLARKDVDARHHRGPRPLAPADVHRRHERGQGRLLREAHGAAGRGRPGRHRRARKRTGRILQVGSQRVSSVVYQKAKDLIEAGAIGEINLVEAWVDRNSAIGAWQYSIPPDASPATIDWDRFLGRAPKRPVRADPPLPLAQLSRLRHRSRRRPVRAPVLGHALRTRIERSDARVHDGRHPVLEGWARRPGRHARALRLSGARQVSGVQSLAARRFQGRRDRECRASGSSAARGS